MLIDLIFLFFVCLFILLIVSVCFSIKLIRQLKQVKDTLRATTERCRVVSALLSDVQKRKE